jgi:hypothetical protein
MLPTRGCTDASLTSLAALSRHSRCPLAPHAPSAPPALLLSYSLHRSQQVTSRYCANSIRPRYRLCAKAPLRRKRPPTGTRACTPVLFTPGGAIHFYAQRQGIFHANDDSVRREHSLMPSQTHTPFTHASARARRPDSGDAGMPPCGSSSPSMTSGSSSRARTPSVPSSMLESPPVKLVQLEIPG